MPRVLQAQFFIVNPWGSHRPHTQENTACTFTTRDSGAFDGCMASSVSIGLPLGGPFSMFGKHRYPLYDARSTRRWGDQVTRERDGEKDFANGVGVELAVAAARKVRFEYQASGVSEDDFKIIRTGAKQTFWPK